MPQRVFPPMPEIGRPEAFYAKMVHRADKANDTFAHEAYKVGQYVTLGLDHKEPPDRKAKYFGHALRRHANPPPDADGHVQDFYRRLADLVRKSAGQEVLRLTRREHEILQKRQAGGANHEALVAEFGEFFKKLTGDHAHHRPDWIPTETWEQVRPIRTQWS